MSATVAFVTGPCGVISWPCACRSLPSAMLPDRKLRVLVTGDVATVKLSDPLCAGLYGAFAGANVALATCVPGAIVLIVSGYANEPLAFVRTVATVALSTRTATGLFRIPVCPFSRPPASTMALP